VHKKDKKVINKIDKMVYSTTSIVIGTEV